jgi:hypothetical protein
LQVDVYSFSMVLWYMCTGERPLAHCQPGDFFRAAAPPAPSTAGVSSGGGGGGGALRPDLSVIRPARLRDLIAATWDPSAAARPAADEVVRWLADMAPSPSSREKASVGKSRCAIL